VSGLIGLAYRRTAHFVEPYIAVAMMGRTEYCANRERVEFVAPPLAV
jgi:hypothetical protein